MDFNLLNVLTRIAHLVIFFLSLNPADGGCAIKYIRNRQNKEATFL